MIVICEDCGRKYRIDPEKIKGKAAKFSCKACGHVIVVSKPVAKPAEPPPPPFIEPDVDATASDPDAAVGPTETKPRRAKKARPPRGSKRISLRTKMFFLFFLLPITFFALSGYLFVRQMDGLTSTLTAESKRIVEQMAQQKLTDISRRVATECKLYLLSRPGLRKEFFNRDPSFKPLAIQRVGMTGYTALYEIPGPDGVWRTWAHVNEKIIGIDMTAIKKSLGSLFPKFWNIYTGVKDGAESKGYYTWRDKDGRLRDKFMVCTPIQGTRYVIAATTYLEEFTQPMSNLEFRSGELSAETRLIVLAILTATILIVAAIVFLYGHRLTSKIKNLTDLAERISIGDLDAEIQIRSNDEIGELSEAISRMQESIRLSIERLRRRR
jgi:predicted Zn finger-like uncharacterized protein